MERRQFIIFSSAGSLLVIAATRLTVAQSPATVRRIGWLSAAGPFDAISQQPITAALRELGWIEGQNLLVERRYAAAAELLRPLAEELVALRVELIATEGTDAAIAAKNATSRIPIVMFSAGDPVRTGLVASLARPGGNVTGYSIMTPDIDARMVTLLRELLPQAKRIGVLVNPNNRVSAVMRTESAARYRSLGMEAMFLDVTSADQIDDAVAELMQRGNHALVVSSDSVFISNRDAVMRAALRYSLPTFVQADSLFEAGGLVFYSVSWDEQCRRHAAVVDKILRGANPRDIPIEQPTKFDLGINLKIAKALGIAVPLSIKMRADRVIE